MSRGTCRRLGLQSAVAASLALTLAVATKTGILRSVLGLGVRRGADRRLPRVHWAESWAPPCVPQPVVS